MPSITIVAMLPVMLAQLWERESYKLVPRPAAVITFLFPFLGLPSKSMPAIHVSCMVKKKLY